MDRFVTLAEFEFNTYAPGTPFVCYDVNQFVFELSDDLLAGTSDESNFHLIADAVQQPPDFFLQVQKQTKQLTS